MGPFADVELDLTAIEGTVIQLAGANGAGKTTLLELLTGALFRQCPTRGKLASLATSRDSSVEVVVCNGKRYTVRQSIDGVSAKGESLITHDGVPVFESGKVSESDRWVAGHFPSAEVLYTSNVSVQGRRGFLDLSASERKAVLLRILRIADLEAEAEQHRERARSAKAHVATLRARLADVPEHDRAALEAQLATATTDAEVATARTRSARLSYERVKEAAASAARAAELAEQRRSVEARLKVSREQLDDIEVRIRNNRVLLGDGDRIRAAAARAGELDDAIATKREEHNRLVRDEDRTTSLKAEASRSLARASRGIEDAAKAIEAIERRLRDADEVRMAAMRLAEWEADGEPGDSARAVASLEAEVAKMETFILSAKDQRIGSLLKLPRELLDAEDAPYQAWAQNTLAEDDRLEAEAQDAPAALESLRRSLQGMRESHRQLVEQIATARSLVKRLQDIEAAELELASAKHAHTQALEAADGARLTLEEAGVAVNEAKARTDAAKHALAALTVEREGLATMLGRLTKLADAEVRIEELSAQLPAIRDAISTAEVELAALPPAPGAEAVDLAVYERAIVTAEGNESDARAFVTQAKDRIVRADEDLAKRAALSAEIDAAEVELSDWTRLGADLGKDGLQALLIDAAIPEINELTNDLMRHCHGSRFTVELRAERLSADGKRSLEGLEVRVVDTEKGRDALAETYSGGECVIVGEALSLALTMVGCARAGIERPTLLRDETGSALDEENGRSYSAMLRRAAAHIGADKVLVVAHGSWLTPDAVVMVKDGCLEVQAS